MRITGLAVLLLLLNTSLIYAQNSTVIRGKITDESGEPLSGATIKDLSTQRGAFAAADGSFQIRIASGREVPLEISYIGYSKDTVYAGNSKTEINVQLHPMPGQVGEVVVESWYDKAEALQQINLKSLDRLPIPSGNIESVLTTMGASSRNEMSSQYSVRGGNFDENLIYVNGIEIYRPMLVKAGQQEGLSFINPSLVSSVQFAAGGFDARYGDKMSSVLDIRYKRPSSFAASASASLLGATAHAEGTAMHNKITAITGIRYKSNQYLINSMQTEGDFKPHFFDVQSFITYDPDDKFEISFLGNLAVNTYDVIPQSRETAFGTYQQPLNFKVYYEGRERDRFITWLGALNLDYHPTGKVSLSLTGSGYNTSEEITYDILGQYWIDMLDNTPGSETAGDSILNLGYGGNLTHARNYLDARIFTLTHKGSYSTGKNQFNWGVSWQNDDFSDRIREWEMIDSAGFSIPYSETEIKLQNVVRSKNNLYSYRFYGFVHDVISLQPGATRYLVNGGIRFNYLSTNGQLVISPRLRVYIIPAWQKKVTFHAAVGLYHQPPFYKEMRDPEGNLFTGIKAQRSIDFLAGATWDFRMWERPFRFSGEAYYKKLDHLVPYVIDNVDIQYIPRYSASGYATGIEFKINGEFVSDAESWATLSFLRTRENRSGDAYGSYPRATDQLVNFGFFFQDYFPDNPSFRLHLNIYFGSRLPYNSTNYDDPSKYYHLQSYRRIDIGLSKSLMTDRTGNVRYSKTLKDVVLSLEIFNLFGFKNQASYQWIRTVSNQEGIPNIFAIPDYLTGRLLNVRLMVKL